ncbi:protein Star-like isoform X2 [Macrobrachium nipponense]|uniref:protein Star-like isoform X2 n=1 Tax=Macrobrachium nipponense TaxID=159736 RepID=UPI0030C87B2A
MVLSRQKFYTILLATVLCSLGYLTWVKNLPSILTNTLKRGQEQENAVGDESWLKGPIEADDPRLLKVIRDRYLIPPSTLPYNLSSPEETRRYYPSSNVSSFHFIDYNVKYFFGDQKTGVFLDSGALEGDIFSNSLWLEKERGWTGILVEVDPNNFRHLVQKRRKSWLSNTCIARGPYPQQVNFEFLDGPPTHGMLWVYRSNSRAIDSPFFGGQDHWSKTANKTYKVMQCLPLASYFLALNLKTLDFLSLDIQGFEADILRSIPYDKVKVRLMAVEYYYEEDDGRLSGGKVDPKLVRFMAGKGYVLVDFDPEGNYIFALKDDPQLKQKLDEKKYVKYYTMLNNRNKPKQ